MYEIKEMEQVFRVKFVTGNARIVVIDADNPNEKFMSDSFVLLNLCRAIIELENKGHIISSVTRVEADGTHPKVKFRNTKEYRYAKKHLSQEDEYDNVLDKMYAIKQKNVYRYTNSLMTT